MKSDFTNLLTTDFVPLSEAKAKLSEQIRKVVSEAKRVAITTNGKPTAVLMSYSDFLELARSIQTPQQTPPIRVLEIEEWKKERPQRLKVRDSLQKLFEKNTSARKGQKQYKRETVRDFKR